MRLIPIQSECFVYLIKCLINNKIYIGSAKNWKDREYSHFRALRNNNHSNARLQNAYNKYGKDNFEFVVLESCRVLDRNIREQFWIDTLKVYDPKIGFNIVRDVKQVPTFKNGKKATRLGHKNKPITLYTRKLLSKVQAHNYLPEEVVVGILTQAYEGVSKKNIAKFYGIERKKLDTITLGHALYVRDIAEKHNLPFTRLRKVKNRSPLSAV